MPWGTRAHQDDRSRRAKKVCPSGGNIQGHQRIKKVQSDPNTRVHGGNILRQLVPLPRRISMPIMPKRSGVPCGENVPPFEERPIRMPKPPQDCRGCYGSTGSCTISFGSILPPEKFPLSPWAYSRGGCPCRKFSRFKWHKR